MDGWESRGNPRKIGSGDLDKKVTIEVPTSEADEYGQLVKGWETLAEPWAAVWPLAGRELVWAQQLHATATYLVIIRKRSGIEASQRVRYQGGYLEIGLVLNPAERGEFLELLCTEDRNRG